MSVYKTSSIQTAAYFIGTGHPFPEFEPGEVRATFVFDDPNGDVLAAGQEYRQADRDQDPNVALISAPFLFRAIKELRDDIYAHCGSTA